MNLNLELFALLSLFCSVGWSIEGKRFVRGRLRRPLQLSAPAQIQCEEGKQLEFELITGFVYSSADDIIESNIGALQLSECLAQCKKNAECLALNFETGLCVLFKTRAGDNSEKLSVSQFPVFTLYSQKVCAPTAARGSSRSPWLYETVPDMRLVDDQVTETQSAQSRSDCANICMLHQRFTCRSASFDSATNTCSMSTIDLNMAVKRDLTQQIQGHDYMEMANKIKPDSMCEFKTIPNHIMKTVDAVHLDTNTTEECRQKCLDSDFNCYSYDFMSAGEAICRLSHHSSPTLAHIREPYLSIDNAITHELQACYQVTIECKAKEMEAQISTSTVFNGKVYARSRPNSCVEDITNSTEFSISLPYNSVECDVVQNGPAMFAADIVIQHHDMIVTRSDVGLALHCKYEMNNLTVTHSLNSGIEVKLSPESEYIEERVVSSPNVSLRVTTRSGEDVIAAQVGDNLALRFEINDLSSPYEIFVRDLVALDGRDSSEILLIDENGCPTDDSIMQSIERVNEGKILHAPFQAFKFPATEVVQFRALVTPCHPKCPAVQCVIQGFNGALSRSSSMGKRRRKREVPESDLMLAQSIKITDKFIFSDAQTSDINKKLVQEECATSFTAVIIAGALFLIAQVVVLMIWSYQWHAKKARKELMPHYPSVPPHLVYKGRSSGPSSLASSTAYLHN